MHLNNKVIYNLKIITPLFQLEKYYFKKVNSARIITNLGKWDHNQNFRVTAIYSGDYT